MAELVSAFDSPVATESGAPNSTARRAMSSEPDVGRLFSPQSGGSLGRRKASEPVFSLSVAGRLTRAGGVVGVRAAASARQGIATPATFMPRYVLQHI